MHHTLVALMQDRPGVLHRAVSLFRRRGFNIESLAVGRSETPGVSRMTLVVEAEEVEQVVRQLYQLVEVLEVTDVTSQPTVERETVLVKVHAPAVSRAPILAVVEAFDARTADVGTTTMIIEMTATPAKVDNFIAVLRPFGIKEMMRGGTIAMTRGMQRHHVRRARGAGAPSGYSFSGGRAYGRDRASGGGSTDHAGDGSTSSGSRVLLVTGGERRRPDAPASSASDATPTPAPSDPPTAQADGVA
jgi:acetolactate synthase I/III small subunit